MHTLTMNDIADQYTLWEDKVVVKKNGKCVIVERDLSMDKIYHAYYWYVGRITS
jgi:sulfur carrier protein ThiS